MDQCLLLTRLRCGVVLLVYALTMSACSEDQPAMTMTDKSGQPAPVVATPSPTPTPETTAETALTIDNTRYFFDVTEHTTAELEELLERVQMVIETAPETFDQLEIVMVLHGPDINLFTKPNAQQNRKLVDLAAKLDALKIVDMRVCEVTMDKLGVSQSDLPPFIESVPFAPDEFKRLKDEGYINL